MSITPLPPADFVPSVKGYSGQGAFRFWCQTVLPLVYDDSLSYYELLNKVVNYLNNLIKDVSTLEDNYQLLYEAFVLLQKYVNTYFDSLDVQEEINHKLDKMVCDGTLTRLIFDYLGYVTPEMYGAKGDGVTDDFEALNSAFQSGKDVRGNDCTYYCSQTITSQNCAHVKCLRVTLAPMAYIAFHADHFLMEHCEFDHGENFMDIENRGEFLVACYGNNVKIANSYFHDTVSALFCGFGQDYVTVCGCHFKNCKESADALTRGVNGYGVVADAAKNLIVLDNIFEDVYRHSVYISISDINANKPTNKAIIARNLITASDREADRYITGFEVPIMCRSAETVEVYDNIFENIFGGCFTFGGEYPTGYTYLNFHHNTVIEGYNDPTTRAYYSAINMLESLHSGNIAVINNNEFRECTYGIVNADKSYKTVISDNIIDTTSPIMYVGYTRRDETAGTIEVYRNHISNANAGVLMYQTAGETSIAENSFETAIGYVFSNSGNHTSNALLKVCDNSASKTMSLSITGMKNLAIYRNTVAESSNFLIDQNASILFYGNVNLNPLGTQLKPCDIIASTGDTGTSISDLLKNTFSRWFTRKALSDNTYTVSISGVGAGVNKQYSGFIDVKGTRIQFLIIDGKNTYSGVYNHASASIELQGISTNQLVPTNENTNKTITFDTSGTHMAIIAERFNSVTLVYFNGASVYTLSITGNAHACEVVNDHAFSFKCQYTSTALVIADTFFNAS